MVSTGPISDSGGMMALTREPSGRRASTIGEDSSMRRPSGATMRLMMRITCSSSLNVMSVSVSLPCRSTQTWCGPLTMISLTASLLINCWIGP